MKTTISCPGRSESHFVRRELFPLRLGLLCLAALVSLPAACADMLDDDLSHGVDPAYWAVENNQSLYTVEATAEGVKLSKPAGGTYSLQWVALQPRVAAQGDFDISVRYTNASIDRIDGSPGNQTQLNCFFADQYLCLVRSDEVGHGHNVHVWASPGAWYGAQGLSDTSGTLRITRTNAHVQAYHNSSLIFERDFDTNAVRYALTLQNNGTRDATAVTFAHFAVAADSLVYEPPQLAIEALASDQVLISWPANPSGYLLQRSPSLADTGLWQAVTNTPVPAFNRLFVTNTVDRATQFYRLVLGP